MHKYKTILPYYLKCRENTKNMNPKISVTNNGKTMILSNCAICGSKKIKIYKNKQGANGFLSSLGIKTPLSKIPLVVLFCFNSYYNNSIK